MTEPEETPRPVTGDSAPSDPAPEGGDRSLRQRIADRWNRPGFTGRASVVLGAATAPVAAAGGIYVLARLRDDEDVDGLAGGVVDLLSPASTEQDTTTPPGRRP